MKDGKLIQSTGLVHVYTGEGKGKTTCALGLALRVIGWGGRVCMVQFIKGYKEIGELEFAAQHPESFTLVQFASDSGRAISHAKAAERSAEAAEALKYAAEVIAGAEFDLVILDEINNALRLGLIGIPDVLQIISQRPPHIELVLTGRNAPEEIIEAADYVSVIKMHKHPYQKNIQARPGIDY